MISVILPTYNERIDYIKQSVGSIINQTYSDLEIIVIVDKPGRDDIAKMIMSQGDDRIKLIEHETNKGLTASLNEAIGLARGEYIARMDADDISMPDRLEKQLRAIADNGLDLVGCNILNIDMDGKEASATTLYPVTDCDVKRFMRYNSPIAHPTWLGKAELFKNNKYVDYFACEDYEFLTRIALQGKKLGNTQEVLLRYRLNSEGISGSKKALQKTSLHYVRKKYKKGIICNYEDYLKYIYSSSGKRMIKSLSKYYSTVDKIKEDKRNKKYILSVVHIIKLALNISAYESIYNSIKTRSMRQMIEKDL